MSKGNQQAPLGKLPRPRSPDALDEIILDYARQHAPQQRERQPLWRSGWVTGMATAGIVAAAVFIADPLRQAPHFDGSAPQLEEAISGDADRRTIGGKLTDTTSAGAAAPQHTRELEVAPQAISQPEAKRMASSEHMEQRQILGDESPLVLDMASEPPPAPAAPAPVAGGEPEQTARALRRSESTHRAFAESRLVEKEAAADSAAAPELDMQLQLRRCITLLLQEDEAAAVECYQELYQHCERCELPETLQQAVMEFKELTSP